MTSIVKRIKGGQNYYYYLYHDSKKNGAHRRQYEEYLGKIIPQDITERKKKFAINIERNDWLPQLETIHKEYVKAKQNIPKSIREKNLLGFSVRFTYNTQRIEGSTLTLKDTSLLLADSITPANKPLVDIKEAEAHQKLFLEIIKQKNDLTSRMIQKWHKQLFINTKSNIAGLVRDYDVRIGHSSFVPPSYQTLNILIKGFFKWYNTNKKKLNPVELAALTHLKFVTVHPFGDGNGRISRLMMNFVLYKHDYPMFDIDYADRRSYYTALERSHMKDDDDELPFLKWFIKRYIKMNQNSDKRVLA